MASNRVQVLLVGKAAALAPDCEKLKLQPQVVEAADALAQIRHLAAQLACVVSEDSLAFKDLREGANRQVFGIALGEALAYDPLQRLQCFDQGARMLAPSLQQVPPALAKVAAVLQDPGKFTCPACGLGKLSENALHLHMHFHHAVDVLPDGPCPICRKTSAANLAVHLHNSHGPTEEREPQAPSYPTFAWCVCRKRSGHFLLVNEPAGISGGRPGYWLPAGRVDRGESLQEACVREAWEEAGVKVRITGLLKLMVGSQGTLRAIFLAEPEELDPEPKSVPDWESVGAMWVHVDELRKLKESDYRHPDPAKLYPQVASGKLQPEPVNTREFKNLEQLIRRLTSADALAIDDVNHVWRKVQDAYPCSIFEY